jgi:hypothetical protein
MKYRHYAIPKSTSSTHSLDSSFQNPIKATNQGGEAFYPLWTYLTAPQQVTKCNDYVLMTVPAPIPPTTILVQTSVSHREYY